jgi:LuxR family transcriptional regulator, maltose regulon positive regulatory protein
MSGRQNPAASAATRTQPGTVRALKSVGSGGRDSAAFEILESKLAIPSLRPRLVRRTALVNRLRAAREARVVQVSAPAGYGKTTLLAQWADRDPRPFAWVSLEHRDDDPVALLTYIAAALDGIHPVDSAVFRGAAAANDSMWSTGLPRLGAALAAMPEPIVLVLDDIHDLQHRDCLDALEPLSKHLPDDSQLVLSGRAENALPFARIRADRRLVEIGPVDLALSDSEAQSLLTAAGVTVTESEAQKLNGHVEGWAAGLHLAALFMQESGDPESLAAFTGKDRFVADYLRSEHLSRLKRAEVEFLTRTAVLDRLNGALCDELLERTGSAKKLQSLEESNFFVVPLDHEREWYRYHHLFGEMLRSELELLEPELAPVLHRRAALWCERNGMVDAAIEHASAGRDLDEVARLVSTFALPFFRSGRVVTVERWFTQFDEPDVLERYPAVAGFGAWIHALRGRPEEADRFAHALEHTSNDGPMPDGSASARPWAAMVRALLCHRGVEAMRADAELALEELGPSSFWRPSALLFLGVGALFEGDLERAEEVLEDTAESATGSGAVHAGLVAHSELALLALGRGDLARAEIELAQAREFLEHQPIEDYVPAALHLAASARLALESGQAASARSLLVSAMRMRAYLSRAIPWFGVQTRLELARAHLNLADVDGARTLLREADDVIQHRPALGTLTQQTRELRTQLRNVTSVGAGWASTLTAAELRLLPLLTTHLSFREIAERLFVSRNTVKSQAISVYRKLDASSRSEAIERAVELGLVDAPLPPTEGGFTPSG